MGEVTVENVQHVARLAKMNLEGESLALLARQLDEIVAYIRTLQSVPTDGVEPTSHVLPLGNVLRPDVRQPSLPAGTAAGLAPARHQDFVSVPKIIES